jgi:Homeodomain-like domain-containing protein
VYVNEIRLMSGIKHPVYRRFAIPDFDALLADVAAEHGCAPTAVRARPTFGQVPEVERARVAVWAELAKRGFTLEEIAELWGCSRSTVGKRLRGAA